MTLTDITYIPRCGHYSDTIRYGHCSACEPYLEQIWDVLDDLVLPAVRKYWAEQNK